MLCVGVSASLRVKVNVTLCCGGSFSRKYAKSTVHVIEAAGFCRLRTYQSLLETNTPGYVSETGEYSLRLLTKENLSEDLTPPSVETVVQDGEVKRKRNCLV